MINHARLAVAFVLVATNIAADARAQTPAEAFPSDTRAYFTKLEQLGFAGVVVVTRTGAPLLAQGFGMADRERGIPWTPGIVSDIGSITKQFTGAAVLLLQEEGRLTVGDPIGKFFPDVPADKRGITIHHLLTHSSGIVDLDGYGDWDPIERDEYVRRSLAQPLAFPVGEGYDYSNAGYSLLGAIVELLTGAPYEQFLRDRLFLPSGMYETGYLLPQWGKGRLAQGYRGDERWGTTLERPMAADGPYWVLRANGGIHATAYDMVRWGQALLDQRVLSPTSMTQYWTPHVSEGGDSYYGYGWVVLTFPPNTKVITHNGGNGIHFADMAIVPDSGYVVFLQTNARADLPIVESLLERIGARLLAGQPYPEVPTVTTVPDTALAPLAGDYTVRGGTLRVTVEGQTLLVEAAGREPFAHLHSTRNVDTARAERLSTAMGRIMSAFVAGDAQPLYDALGGRASIESLQRNWEASVSDWESTYGPLRGYEILGTAMRPGRDETVVRFLFERGHAERTYVWDESDDRLLGYSRRGLDTRLRFYPAEGGAYSSWDRITGSTQRLAIERQGKITSIALGTGSRTIRGRRR